MYNINKNKTYEEQIENYKYLSDINLRNEPLEQKLNDSVNEYTKFTLVEKFSFNKELYKRINKLDKDSRQHETYLKHFENIINLINATQEINSLFLINKQLVFPKIQ